MSKLRLRRVDTLPQATNEDEELLLLSRTDLLSIPDARDGLTMLERTILHTLYELRKEYGERTVPSVLLFGRVVEKLDVNRETFLRTLEKLRRDSAQRR